MEREEVFLSVLERVCEMCVCLRWPRVKEGKEEVIFEVILAWRYVICCMEIQKTIMRWQTKVNSSPLLLGLGPWAENLEGKGKFGLFALKPNIRVSLGEF